MESDIQVVVRVRPKNANEAFKTEIVEHDNEKIRLLDSDKHFEGTYNRILGQDASQESVFNVISSILGSCDTGISSTIMAYGQTGSGKTYTIFGDKFNSGIIPRVFSYLFSSLTQDYTILCSMIQLYNEYIYDMLQDQNLIRSLRIRQDPLFGLYLEGLTEYVIQSPEEGIEIINRGETTRAIRMTNMSQSSSRSHMICQITIESNKPNEKGNLSRAKINLCDLAGNERIGKVPGINAETMKESASINKSLSALGNVIWNLSRGENKFVPYRDSKLTYLLKESLEGNARICLIATISPISNYIYESIDTLRFANMTKRLSLHAKANEISVADNKLIQRLQKEIRYLKDCMKIPKNSEDLHHKLISLQEENDRLKETIAPTVNIDSILQENQKMKVQLKKIMEMTGGAFGVIDAEGDELDKFCDRYKSAPSQRNMTPLITQSSNISKPIEVRIRQKNNSVEKRMTTIDKTFEQHEKDKGLLDQINLRNKRIKTLEQIEQFREMKAKIALEKYEQTKLNESELMKKMENAKEKQYSELNIKRFREIDTAKKILAKAEEEKEKAFQDLAKIRMRRDSRSPLRSAATQQIFLPKIN